MTGNKSINLYIFDKSGFILDLKFNLVLVFFSIFIFSCWITWELKYSSSVYF